MKKLLRTSLKSSRARGDSNKMQTGLRKSDKKNQEAGMTQKELEGKGFVKMVPPEISQREHETGQEN